MQDNMSVDFDKLDGINQTIMLNLYNLQLDILEVNELLKDPDLTEDQQTVLLRRYVKLHRIQNSVANIIREEY